MPREKQMHDRPLHFHVTPQIRGWLNRWSKKNKKSVAEICRDVLTARYQEAHSK